MKLQIRTTTTIRGEDGSKVPAGSVLWYDFRAACRLIGSGEADPVGLGDAGDAGDARLVETGAPIESSHPEIGSGTETRVDRDPAPRGRGRPRKS